MGQILFTRWVDPLCHGLLDYNQELREKALTVNKELSEIYRETDLHLIHNSKNMKQQHLNKDKLHLNQKGVKVLSDIYLKDRGKILN